MKQPKDFFVYIETVEISIDSNKMISMAKLSYSKNNSTVPLADERKFAK